MRKWLAKLDRVIVWFIDQILEPLHQKLVVRTGAEDRVVEWLARRKPNLQGERRCR
jgi:hypothetical protein